MTSWCVCGKITGRCFILCLSPRRHSRILPIPNTGQESQQTLRCLPQGEIRMKSWSDVPLRDMYLSLLIKGSSTWDYPQTRRSSSRSENSKNYLRSSARFFNEENLPIHQAARALHQRAAFLLDSNQISAS